MPTRTRHRRWGAALFALVVLAVAAPAAASSSYCAPDREMRVVNGYLQAVPAGTTVTLALKSAPSTVLGGTTTSADGTWAACVTLPSSGTYYITVGSARREQFLCLADLLPTPTPTATP